MLLIPFIDNLGNSHIPFFIVREIQKKKKNMFYILKKLIITNNIYNWYFIKNFWL